MNSKMSGRYLFGGTMLAAGLVSGPASAQTFSFVYSDVFLAAFDASDNDPLDYQRVYGSGFLSGGVSNTAGSANVAFSPYSITMDVTASDVNGAAYARATHDVYAASSYFSPTADATLDISWDFSVGASGGTVLLIADPGGNVIFFADTSNPVGNAQVPIYAGIGYYGLLGDIVVTDGNGTSWYSVVIPAPSSGALLALGGLLAMRRRR